MESFVGFGYRIKGSFSFFFLNLLNFPCVVLELTYFNWTLNIKSLSTYGFPGYINGDITGNNLSYVLGNQETTRTTTKWKYVTSYATIM